MTADYDTFLFLFDPSLALATIGGEEGPPNESRIVTTLDETGTWSLWANNYSAVSGSPGDYTLSLTCPQLVVPGFEVDVVDPEGPTTFFAVRNTTDAAIEVDVVYHGEEVTATPLRTDVFNLGPQQTLTRNVGSNLFGLPIDGDGFATGLMLISKSNGNASGLEGDYFRIDSGNDFATGDRLVSSEDYCDQQEVRFVDFGSGSRVRVLLAEPQGAAQPSFRYTAYRESGASIFEVDVFASDHLNVFDVDALVPFQRFGTLVFDFSNSGGGFVTAEYSAFGRYSVELNAACRAPSP